LENLTFLKQKKTQESCKSQIFGEKNIYNLKKNYCNVEITQDDTKTDKSSLRNGAELTKLENQEERRTTTSALFMCWSYLLLSKHAF